MGLIILFAVMATIVAFLLGIAVAGTDSPDNDNPTFTKDKRESPRLQSWEYVKHK